MDSKRSKIASLMFSGLYKQPELSRAFEHLIALVHESGVLALAHRFGRLVEQGSDLVAINDLRGLGEEVARGFCAGIAQIHDDGSDLLALRCGQNRKSHHGFFIGTFNICSSLEIAFQKLI